MGINFKSVLNVLVALVAFEVIKSTGVLDKLTKPGTSGNR